MMFWTLCVSQKHKEGKEPPKAVPSRFVFHLYHFENMPARSLCTLTLEFQVHGIAVANIMSYLVSLYWCQYMVDWPEGFDFRWI